ncbi:MAG: hypothetical protein NTX61_13815, partial [Bacteroidetes bacterium]|nr:hypothetical protein [Bacteroidota bacterium]
MKRDLLSSMLRRSVRIGQLLPLLAILVFLTLYTKVQAQNCTVNAGIDQTICENSTLTLHGVTSGLYTGSGNIHWIQTGGPSVYIVNPYTLTTNVTGCTGGHVYTFSIMAKCQDGTLPIDPVYVTVLAMTFANAGGDYSSCPGTGVITLGGNSPSGGETGLWQVVGANNGVTIVTPGSPTSSVNLSATSCGITTLRWTISGGDGCMSYDDMTITNRGGVSTVSTGGTINVSHCYSTTTSATLSGSYGGCGIDSQTGHWTVISGPNLPTFSNAYANNSTVSNLIQGTYVFRWTVSGPCVTTAYADQTVIVPPPTSSVTGANANAGGGAQTFCDGRTVFTLTGNNPLYVGETVNWSTNRPGEVTFGSPTNPITSVTVTSATGTYTFTYTITNSVTICSSSASTSVVFTTAPTLSLSGDPILPCNSTTATINYDWNGAGNLQWQLLSGPTNSFYPVIPTGYSDATHPSPQVIYNLLNPGIYIIRFRSSTGTGASCSTVTADFSVTISFDAIGSNSGTPQVLGCMIHSTTLAGNAPEIRIGPHTYIPGGTGTWSVVLGFPPEYPANITDINSNVSPISNLYNNGTKGTYRLRWLISGGPSCPSQQSETRIVVLGNTPLDVNAGDDETVCYNTPYVLQGSEPAPTEIGTWTYPLGVTISDPHFYNATVSGLAAHTDYTFTWTVENACSSISDDVVITTDDTQGPVTADAGPDQCLTPEPGGNTTTMAANDPGAGSGMWEQFSGPALYPSNIVDITDPNTDVTDLYPGTYIFTWTISADPCNSNADTVKITIANPVTTALAGPDQTECSSSGIIHLASPNTLPLSENETGTWTQTMGNGGSYIVSPHYPTSEIDFLTSGNYQFTWTISNGICQSSSDDMMVYYSVPPSPAAAGLDQTLCSAAPVTTHLAADPPTSGTGLWSVVSGPNVPTFDSYTLPNAYLTNLMPGAYTFKWTTSGGPYCAESTDLVNITVYEIANAGADQSYCNAVSVNLTGNIGSTGTWSATAWPGPPDPPDPTNQPVITPSGTYSAIASALITGSYTFRYDISAPGCTSYDDMNVVISGQPSTADAGSDQTLTCGTTTIQLGAIVPIPLVGTGLWTLLGPSDPTGSFDDATKPDAIYTKGTDTWGDFVFVWTISQGSCSNSDQVRFTDYGDPPVPPIAGSDQTICGTTVTMNAVEPDAGHGIGTWSQLPGGPNTASITSILDPHTTITGLIQGSYIFRWTAANGNCISTYADVNVLVHTNPTTAYAGIDQTICGASDATITAGSVTLPVYGLWTQDPSNPSDATITNASANSTTVTGLNTAITYKFIWTTYLDWSEPGGATGTCSTSDEVSLLKCNPPTTADAGFDQTLCLYQAVTLAGNNPSTGTGTWTQLPGGPSTVTFAYPHLYNTAVYGTVQGTYVFRWTIATSGCTPSSDDVTIIINPLPTQAIAGPNQIICSGIYDYTTMDANSAISGTGTWSWVDPPSDGPGPVVFADIHNPETSVTVTSNGTYTFTWAISTGTSGCTSSDDMKIFKYSASVVTGPNDATICSGGSANLSVTASAGSGSYTYQWYSGTSNMGPWTTIINATNASYSTGALTSDLYYYAEVECGLSNSRAAFVHVVPSPDIFSQPVGATICSGSDYNLTVSASGGTPTLLYQWQSNGNGCSGYTNIPGATASSYHISALTQSRYYRVRVSADGDNCATTYSNCASVMVPVITSNPSGYIICYEGTHTMTVSASGGTSYTYLWQYRTPPATGYTDITTATDITYTTFSLSSDTYFRTIISSPSTAGPICALVTNSAFVQVVADPTFVTIPSDATICSGGTQDLSVSATGGTPSLNYQWQYYNDPDWYNAPGTATNTSYTTPALTGTTQYRVLVSAGGNGCTTAQSTATVTVNPDPNVYDQPDNITICSNTHTTLSMAASGGTPSLDYHWQWSTTGSGSWTDLGAGTSSYTTPDLTLTTFYRVIISAGGNGCTTTTSANAEVSIPHITTEPSDVTICTGGPGSPTLNIAASTDGGTATFAYQWQTSTTSGSGFSDILNATNTSYTTDELTSDTYYRVIITSNDPVCTLNSREAHVSVLADPIITAEPSDGTICTGGTGTMTVSASGGTPSLVYQWQYYNDPNWQNPSSGGQSASYNTPALTTTTLYRVIVSATGIACTPYDISRTTTITVVPDPNISDQPDDATICTGGTQDLFITATGDAATGTITYHWEISPTGTGSWSNVGSNTNNYTTAPLTITTYYRCEITQVPSGCLTTSGNARVTVVADPTITAEPSDATICTGGDRELSVSASGGTPFLLYQWEYDNGGWINAPGTSTNTTYTTPSLTSTTQYRVIISATGNGCTPSATSRTTIINVVDDPTITSVVSDATKCNNLTFTMTVSASGGWPGLVYQWQSSSDHDGTYLNVSGGSGATSTSYTTPALTMTTFYRVLVNASGVGLGCDQAVSNIYADTVNRIYPGAISQDHTICRGDTPLAFSSTTDATGGGAITYQWQSSTTSGSSNFTNISGATDATFAPGSLTTDTWYRRFAFSTLHKVVCPDYTTPALENVVNYVNPATLTNAQAICYNIQPVAWNTSTAPAPTYHTGDAVTYQWQNSTDGSSFIDISGATGQTYAPPALTTDTWYRRNDIATINSHPCSGYTNIIKISVNFIIPGTVASSQNLCRGDIPAGFTSTLDASGHTGATITYQWQWTDTPSGTTNYANISNATVSTYSVPSGLIRDTWYRRVCTSVLTAGTTATCVDVTPALTMFVNNVNAGAIAASQDICTGGTPAGFTSATAPSTDGTASYKWQSSTSGATSGFSDISSATNLTYQAGALSQDTWYRRFVTSTSANVCDSATTAVKVTIHPDPAVDNPSGTTICSNGTYNMTVSGSGGSPILLYQWQQSSSDADGSWSNATGGSGATSNSYTTPGLTTDTYYRVIVWATDLGCTLVASNSALVYVNALNPGSIATAQTICYNTSPAAFTSSPATAIHSGDGAVISYQWQSSTNGTSYGNISTATDETYASGALTVDTYFRRTATSTFNSLPCYQYTVPILVYVNFITPGSLSNVQTICSGSTPAQFTTSNASAATGHVTPPSTITYQWQSSTDGTTFGDISGQTNRTYVTVALTTDTWY